jgi:hypothetical protein
MARCKGGRRGELAREKRERSRGRATKGEHRFCVRAPRSSIREAYEGVKSYARSRVRASPASVIFMSWSPTTCSTSNSCVGGDHPKQAKQHREERGRVSPNPA